MTSQNPNIKTKAPEQGGGYQIPTNSEAHIQKAKKTSSKHTVNLHQITLKLTQQYRSHSPPHSTKMCNGRPYKYECGHDFVDWSYCGHSQFDPETNLTYPCQYASRAGEYQLRRDKCDDWCTWNGKSWTCCQCRNSPINLAFCERLVQREGRLEQCAHMRCKACRVIGGETSLFSTSPCVCVCGTC